MGSNYGNDNEFPDDFKSATETADEYPEDFRKEGEQDPVLGSFGISTVPGPGSPFDIDTFPSLEDVLDEDVVDSEDDDGGLMIVDALADSYQVLNVRSQALASAVQLAEFVDMDAPKVVDTAEMFVAFLLKPLPKAAAK